MNTNITYEEYVTQLTTALKEQSLTRGLSLDIRKVAKNNNVLLDAVSVTGQKVSSTVYMQNFFNAFCSGMPLQEIVDIILEEVSKPVADIEEKVARVFNYEDVSNLIIPALINYKQNEEYLQTVPHRKFLDLAEIYMVCFNEDEEIRELMKITDSVLNLWGISKEELREKAMANVRRKNFFSAASMYEMCEEMLKRMEEKEEQNDLSLLNAPIVLSAKVGGASVLLFPEIFQSAMEKYHPNESKLLIFPCSIGEVIAMPYPKGERSMNAFRGMVREVNSTSVLPEEILSNM